MNIQERLRNAKNKMTEAQQNQQRLIEIAKIDETAWLKLYFGKSFKDTGVVLITPVRYGFETTNSSYRFDAAVERLFAEFFKRDLVQEVSTTDIPWKILIPKVYNTITIELDALNMDISMYLPGNINEFQINQLKNFQDKVNAYKENGIPYKIKIGGRTDTIQSIDELLEKYYNIDKTNSLKLK